MSFTTFVEVMLEHEIDFTTESEYNAAYALYEQDLQDEETDADFKTWLEEHISYKQLEGY